MTELKASVVAFAVVFVSYGIVSSITAAVVGASFGISPFSHALISIGVYAFVGLLLGAACGVVLGFYQNLTGIVLPDRRTRFVFYASAAVSFFYFFQCIFFLQPYVQVHLTRSFSKEIISVPLAIVLGLFLIFFHRFLSSPGRGRRRSPLAGLVLLVIVGLSLLKTFGVAPQRFDQTANNVFLISVDTVNVDFIGSYGNPEVDWTGGLFLNATTYVEDVLESGSPRRNPPLPEVMRPRGTGRRPWRCPHDLSCTRQRERGGAELSCVAVGGAQEHVCRI